MAQLKLTKSELRAQQYRLGQLQRYLPTLQLKKAMLQIEVDQTLIEIERLKEAFHTIELQVRTYQALFSAPAAFDLFSAVKIASVERRYENIAGVDIPIFETLIFPEAAYPLFDTPLWLEGAIEGVKRLLTAREKVKVAEEKKRALAKELREVSIRVNLFEKILIPRSLFDIKKIKIFLGDQQLAAVAQAKVSKRKILMRKANSGIGS